MSQASISRRAILAGAGLLASRFAQAQPAFAIGTGTTGGVYYPLGTAMATLINAAEPTMGAAAVATQGSIENLDRLGTGGFSLVFTQVDTAVNAVDGEEHFNRKPLPLRALANLYSGRMQLVTTAKSGIRRTADLRGKRVSTGTPNSGNEAMAFRLLKVAAIDRTMDFAALEFLSPEEGTRRILRGELDAYFFNSGIPSATIMELCNAPGVELRLIDHADLTDGIVARYGPVYYPEAIPAGTYPGQKAANNQVSVGNILAVSAAMPDAVAAKVLSALWAGRATLIDTHREGRNFTIAGQRSKAVGIPWHPAAEAFWQKQGASL